MITWTFSAEGRRWVPLQEISECFTGVALELWPSVGFERRTEKESIRPADLFRRTVGLKRALLQIFLLSLCLEAIALLSPIGSQIIFDEVVVASDHDLLTLVAIGMACLVLLQVVFGLARSWAALVIGTNLSMQWTAALFDHMLNLPLTYFEKRHARLEDMWAARVVTMLNAALSRAQTPPLTRRCTMRIAQ